MNINSNGYVLGFAVGICVVMSAALALTSSALKETQRAAAEFDRQKNVMMAAALLDADGRIAGQEQAPTREQLEQLYAGRVEEKVLTLATGEFATGMTPLDYAKLKGGERDRYRVVAIAKDPAGKPGAYVLPIAGKGLWSILYGYLALQPDGNTVKGITFYKHGETPGLGGECENPEWTAKWVGKTIREGDKLVGITVKKGKVDPNVPAERDHQVDGLSGATITSRGITVFLADDLDKKYRPFLAKLWSKSN